jgi:hypothetical protein
MRNEPWKVSAGFLLLLMGPLAGQSFAQQAPHQTPDTIKVMQLTGLIGVKNKTKGSVKVEGGTLEFVHAKVKTDLAVPAIQDVVTGNDSERAIHGFVGTLTMFAPYGSGRFLSLFRTKLDTLTLQYRDDNGGLRGAIFTMDVGKADALKKLLMAQGAHTSIPDDPGGADAKADPTKEKKP